MDDDQVRQVAGLLRERNAIDAAIAQITGRPVASGHLGEWLAAQIFEIDLEVSASAAAIDGRFHSGPLQGKTVNIKWYTKHQGLLDTTESPVLDYYLIMAGPPSPAASSRGTHRPWCIDAVYLFDARQLRDQQASRGGQARHRLQRDPKPVGRGADLPAGDQPAAGADNPASRTAQPLRA